MFASIAGAARAGVRAGFRNRMVARRTRDRHAAFVLALLVAAFTAACDAPAADDRVASAIVVVDDAGDTVRLAAPARRIVSLVPAQTEVLLALGVTDRIIARTDFDTQPAIRHLPSTGNGLMPNVEWIAAQRPDLVISWADAQ